MQELGQKKAFVQNIKNVEFRLNIPIGLIFLNTHVCLFSEHYYEYLRILSDYV